MQERVHKYVKILFESHIFLSRMNEARAFAAGAHHPQLGFLVSGGYDGSFNLLSTSEISTDGMTFSTFTPLPTPVYRHCMVALDGDDGEFFLAGGWHTGPASRRTFIHRRDQWDEVDLMPTARGGKKLNLKMQIRYAQGLAKRTAQTDLRRHSVHSPYNSSEKVCTKCNKDYTSVGFNAGKK